MPVEQEDADSTPRMFNSFFNLREAVESEELNHRGTEAPRTNTEKN